MSTVSHHKLSPTDLFIKISALEREFPDLSFIELRQILNARELALFNINQERINAAAKVAATIAMANKKASIAMAKKKRQLLWQKK
jgi:hypothetical protein